MTKAEKIIEAIELDYIERVEPRIEERKKLLPLTKPEQIKALIYNLLSSDKWRKQISYRDYSAILNIWLDRIRNK